LILEISEKALYLKSINKDSKKKLRAFLLTLITYYHRLL